ncbi:amidophosphoribosyltransferase [Batrachochytrium salamandrivorans]|nr:amidophosphoribosyltransferase [Batrachochytrium salamandrivorans]
MIQDAAGIITCGQKGRLYQCKANGMVRDVFNPSQLSSLVGNMGVSHVRYPTAGTSSNSEAQPFYVNSPYGIVLYTMGISPMPMVREFLDQDAHRHVNTESDSELLLYIANNLQQTGKFRTNEEDIFAALTKLYGQCRGGYACVAMIAGFGLIGFRDPNGIRPLIFGERVSANGKGKDFMLSSESVCLEALGYTNFQDVVLARHSIMDGISVYKARLAMGEALARVFDTSRSSALQVSYKLNKLYREGFIKNRYIGRTFIMPGQQLRVQSVRRKLNPMTMEFAGKSVLIVDDSIVRGTTSREIVQMAREAGARKVYFASCSPAIRFPNVYGIDMPTRSELIAFGRKDDEVAEAIGADCVIFQHLDDLVESVAKFSDNVRRSINLERQRSESAKKAKVPVSENVIGLHNQLHANK